MKEAVEVAARRTFARFSLLSTQANHTDQAEYVEQQLRRKNKHDHRCLLLHARKAEARHPLLIMPIEFR